MAKPAAANPAAADLVADAARPQQDPTLQPVTASAEQSGTSRAEARSQESRTEDPSNGFEPDWPAGFIGSDTRTGATRAAEPKDVAWSYQSEQLLTQYLATHPPAAHFEIRAIDCRTTFCQIRAVSSNPDASPMWMRIGHEIGQQPWSDFAGYGTSTSTKTPSGREALIMFLPRKPRTR